MTFSQVGSSGRAKVLAAIIALAVLGAAAAVGYYVRRGRSSASEAATTPWPSISPTSTSTPAAAVPEPTCVAGESGPLRLDSQFTADDGRQTVVNYSVSLPEDYYSACRSYPVLYALHGKGESNITFMDPALSMRRAMAAEVLDQAIIVTPDSYLTGRWENRDTGPAEDNFIKQLIPYVEQNYRVEPGPSHRLLVGFSMGGHGAMRFGLKYPEMFAAVWSVDGAMGDPADYLPFVAGKTTADFHIIAVGGQLNGDRVQALIDALKGQGIEIPYAYQNREHEFRAFVDEDEKAGWYVMKYLQGNLGRAV